MNIFHYADFFMTDIVERFHITAFMLFVLAQNLLEAEGPWFESFLTVSFSHLTND